MVGTVRVAMPKVTPAKMLFFKVGALANSKNCRINRRSKTTNRFVDPIFNAAKCTLGGYRASINAANMPTHTLKIRLPIKNKRTQLRADMMVWKIINTTAEAALYVPKALNDAAMMSG